MGYRVGFYVLVLAVGLLGAMGLGFLEQGKRSQGQSAVSAAPVADNGTDNGGADNAADNGYDNGYDNGGDNDGGPPPPPTATPTRTPTGGGQQPPPPPPPPAPAPSGPCQFVLGFQFLHSQLNGRDGNCIDNEHNDPNGTGDRVQGTFNPATGVQGYMVWQLATNTMRWTDGFRTFTYSSCGLQERLNTQSWVWEQNPSIVVGGVVPPGGCALAGGPETSF
jgi:hypothetical protein